MTIRFSTLAAGLVLLAPAAWADSQPSTKFYVGADLGATKLDGTLSNTFFGAQDARPDGNDNGFKVTFGIQVSRIFAVEAGYADFGRFSVHDIEYACPVGTTPPCTYDVTTSSRGPFTNLVVAWPFAEGWALKGRIGAQYADISVTERDPNIAGSTVHNSDSSWGILYGAGISYQVNPRWAVGLNWARNDQLALGLSFGGGQVVYDVGSSTMTSLGVTYRF